MKSLPLFNVNTNATNESGFTAFPDGYRMRSGGFTSIGWEGHWWSATGNDSDGACDTEMIYNGSNVGRVEPHAQTAFSLRCLKD